MKVMLTPLGVLYIFFGIAQGCAGLFVLLYALFPAIISGMAVGGAANGEEGALGALVLMLGTTTLVVLVGLAICALAIAYIVDGAAIIARIGWSRWLGIGLALPMMLVCMPFGALFGLFALVTLLMPDVGEEFAKA